MAALPIEELPPPAPMSAFPDFLTCSETRLFISVDGLRHGHSGERQWPATLGCFHQTFHGGFPLRVLLFGVRQAHHVLRRVAQRRGCLAVRQCDGLVQLLIPGDQASRSANCRSGPV